MITRRLLTGALAAAPFSVTAMFAGAQSSDPKFAAWLQGLRAEAARAGVDGHTLDAALGSVEQVPQVLDLAHSQPEFKMTFERYLEIVVPPERVARGRTLLKENSALLQRFSGSSGVPDAVIAALKIVAEGNIGLHAMKGSWAGAMGQCQFMPTSFLAYAADGDGDGRRDIWTNKADVFASITNYLRRVGWRAGIG